jgi:hypothetical protein
MTEKPTKVEIPDVIRDQMIETFKEEGMSQEEAEQAIENIKAFLLEHFREGLPSDHDGESPVMGEIVMPAEILHKPKLLN